MRDGIGSLVEGRGKRSVAVILGSFVAAACTLAFCLTAAPADASLTHPYQQTVEGTSIGSFDRGLCGLAIDHRTDEPYVLNFGYDAIDILTPDLEFSRRISAADSPGSLQDEFKGGSCQIGSGAVNGTTGQIAIAPDAWEPDSTPYPVHLFNASGTFEGFIEAADIPQGPIEEFNNAISTDIDPGTGDILLTTAVSPDQGLITRFDSEGNFVDQLTGLSTPGRIAIDSERFIYVSEGESVRKLTPDLVTLEVLTGPRGGASQMAAAGR